MKPIGERGRRMRQGKVAANTAEDAWMEMAQDFGCIVCHLQQYGYANAEIHHLKQGDRRRGHLYSIPLCPPHHRHGAAQGLYISLHPYKARFEAMYGKEEELLHAVREFLAELGHVVPELPDIKEEEKNMY